MIITQIDIINYNEGIFPHKISGGVPIVACLLKIFPNCIGAKKELIFKFLFSIKVLDKSIN
jgi:hypothetical protein